MSFGGPALENRDSVPVPRLLVELPSRPRVFFGNLGDLLLHRRAVPLQLNSSPGEFWPDVFVIPRLPWSRFLQSAIYHVLAAGILIGISQVLALRPRVVAQPRAFDHSQVVYYQASKYLPPLDTRPPASSNPEKADPEFAPQPIISVPAESDNHSQTIVAPPNVRLKHDMPMPNVVAWSDSLQKPQLEIPTAPVVPASQITRLAPTVQNSVVTPPPDAARIQRTRSLPALESSVVAPPPNLEDSNARAAVEGLQPVLIAPPPSVATTSVHRLGEINIAPSSVIAPAPQLPVAAQRTSPGGTLAGAGATQIVPPPPAVSASGSAAGSQGRLIALNLHPAVTAPPNPPAGNRRGTFAAMPEGRSGASGSPGSSSAASRTNTGSGGIGGTQESGADSAGKTGNDLPSGLYVGKAAAKPDAVAGDPTNKPFTDAVNPNLIASVRPPRITSSRPMQPESTTKLSEAEREVFAGRKFYSVTLNMPNLNSGGGSWVIRFAELKHESDSRDPNSPSADLSQPTATRKVDPAYPTQLMRQNVSGTVIVYAVIHADGTVGSVRVLRGVDERLDRFASEAVAQWKFDPATKNGQPVDVEATFQIPFRPTRFGSNF
jgi:TonB family protein